MANCITFADIEEQVCAAADNVPGVAQTVEIGLADDVLTWPDMPAGSAESPLTMEAAGKLVDNLVLKKDAARCKFTYTRNSGEFTMTEQGDPGYESVLCAFTFDRAKISADVLGFLNATRGRRLFAVVTDKNGQKYLMGDKVNAAYRVAADAVTTGAGTTDANKVPVKIEYVCPRHLVFTGSVTETTGA